MVKPLLLNAIDKSTTLAFTSTFPKQPSIERFFRAHDYTTHHLFTDSFLAYFNRKWFEKTFGEKTLEIEAKTLWSMSYVTSIDASDILPFWTLFNPDMPHYSLNVTDDFFGFLQNDNTFYITNASQKPKIEQDNPYVKGIKIKNPPMPLKNEYYFL